MLNMPNPHSHGSLVVPYVRRPSKSPLLKYPLCGVVAEKHFHTQNPANRCPQPPLPLLYKKTALSSEFSYITRLLYCL